MHSIKCKLMTSSQRRAKQDPVISIAIILIIYGFSKQSPINCKVIVNHGNPFCKHTQGVYIYPRNTATSKNIHTLGNKQVNGHVNVQQFSHIRLQVICEPIGRRIV